MDMGRGEEGVRCMERVTWKLALPCIKDSQWEFAVWLRKLMRLRWWAAVQGVAKSRTRLSNCTFQESQTGVLYQPRGIGWGGRCVGGSKERGYMCTYG